MRLKYLSLLSTVILVSCSSNVISSSSCKEHSYDEVSNLTITYDQGFSISENDHYLYFYQETCHSCSEIKDMVIDFALNKYVEIYFIVATTEIPHNYSLDEINLTLGSNNVNDLFVGITPQLVLVKNGKIEKNIAKTIYIESELSQYQK